MSSTSSPLPPVRLVITAHDSSGKAIVAHDDPANAHPLGPSESHDGKTTVASFIDLYRTEDFPSSNGVPGEKFHDPSVGKESELMSEGGSIFRAVDFPPESVTPFHRTISIDYAIVVRGSVICELDDNNRTTLNPGDVIVQRGTIHAWINESKTEWSRVFYVMLPSKKVEVDGKPLELEFR